MKLLKFSTTEESCNFSLINPINVINGEFKIGLYTIINRKQISFSQIKNFSNFLVTPISANNPTANIHLFIIEMSRSTPPLLPSPEYHTREESGLTLLSSLKQNFIEFEKMLTSSRPTPLLPFQKKTSADQYSIIMFYYV